MRTFQLVAGPDVDLDESRTGASAGDYSLGAEPSARFTWASDAGTFVTVTETAYVVGRRDDDDRDLDASDWTEALEAQDDDDSSTVVRYAVEQVTEWTEHADRDDVGGTEIRSDYEHGTDQRHALYFRTLEDAEAAARAVIRSLRAEDYAPANWR